MFLWVRPKRTIDDARDKLLLLEELVESKNHYSINVNDLGCELNMLIEPQLNLSSMTKLLVTNIVKSSKESMKKYILSIFMPFFMCKIKGKNTLFVRL